MTIKQSKNDTRKAFRKKLPTAKKKVRESSMKLVRKIGKVLAKRHKKSKARAASTKLSQKIAKVLAERHEMKVRQGVSHRTVTSEAIGVNDKVAWTPKAGWAGAGYTGVPLTEFTCFLKLPLELQRKIWLLVPTLRYDTKQIHLIVGFHEREIKRNPQLNSMYNAHLNFRPCNERQKPIQLGRLDSNPNHIFFLSAVPNHKLLYVCSSARQIIIKCHNLSFLFGTWMNPDRDVIMCYDARGQNLTGKHIWPHEEFTSMECDRPAWLEELMEDGDMRKVKRLVLSHWIPAGPVSQIWPFRGRLGKLERLRAALPNLDCIYATTDYDYRATKDIYGKQFMIIDSIDDDEWLEPTGFVGTHDNPFDFGRFLASAPTVALL